MLRKERKPIRSKKRPRRGLSDVSHIFLSGAEKKEDEVKGIRDARFRIPDANYICITSGEKVRGKTSLAANLAFGLLTRGWKVALVSADSEKPDVVGVTGSIPAEPGGPVMRSDSAFGSMPMVDASSQSAVDFSKAQDMGSPLAALEVAAREAPSVVIDTSPWPESSRTIWMLARSAIVLVEPEVEKMRASYLTVKRIHLASPDTRIGLVVNMIKSYAEGEQYYKKMASVCRSFLRINLRNYGFIVRDAAITKACEAQLPLTRAFPESEAAKCIDSIVGLIMMEESAIAKRRKEVTVGECALRKGQ